MKKESTVETNPTSMTPEEVARLINGAETDVPSKAKAKTIKPEKLLNQKYYRTVNIDLDKEEQAAAEVVAQAKKAADDEKTTEDYKVILKGMGFKV